MKYLPNRSRLRCPPGPHSKRSKKAGRVATCRPPIGYLQQAFEMAREVCQSRLCSKRTPFLTTDGYNPLPIRTVATCAVGLTHLTRLPNLGFRPTSLRCQQSRCNTRPCLPLTRDKEERRTHTRPHTLRVRSPKPSSPALVPEARPPRRNFLRGASLRRLCAGKLKAPTRSIDALTRILFS